MYIDVNVCIYISLMAHCTLSNKMRDFDNICHGFFHCR